MIKKQTRKFEIPVDEKQETPMSQEEFQEAFDSLVEDGSLVPTGELERGGDGKFYPVYVADIYAEHYATASAIAQKKRRCIN